MDAKSAAEQTMEEEANGASRRTGGQRKAEERGAKRRSSKCDEKEMSGSDDEMGNVEGMDGNTRREKNCDRNGRKEEEKRTKRGK